MYYALHGIFLFLPSSFESFFLKGMSDHGRLIPLILHKRESNIPCLPSRNLGLLSTSIHQVDFRPSVSAKGTRGNQNLLKGLSELAPVSKGFFRPLPSTLVDFRSTSATKEPTTRACLLSMPHKHPY